MSNKIRKAAVAGHFYSREKETLQREVAMFLENSLAMDRVQRIYGLVAPHAGYLYSGGVAARAYRQVVDLDFDVVVVIAPSHHVYFEEVSVYNGEAYHTPSGRIQVDIELACQLEDAHQNIILSDLGHSNEEHSLEVQLPFLQHVLDDFKLLPIVMGNQDEANINALSGALSEVLQDKKALVVASSDLSHYHSYDKAALLDKVAVESINNFDDQQLFSDWQNGVCELCGGGPVLVTMKTCRNLGATKSKVLLYRNSGDVGGDKSQVVGYLSAIFYE